MRVEFLRRHGRAAAWTAVLLAAAVPLSAHAILKQSDPTVDSTVAGPAVDVKLEFNSRIDAVHSKLALAKKGSPTGENLEIDKTAPPNLLEGHAKDLKSGAYEIQWQVLAIDGHITRGVIPFHVK